MNVIVPRWEFRVFGDDFGVAESRIREHEAVDRTSTAERYVTSLASGNNVKIRNGTLDLKVLEKVNDRHLERWRPVLKSTFPITRENALAVLEGLSVPLVALPEATYALEDFLDRIARPSPLLRVVEVAKTRERFVLDECLVEITDLTIDGRPTRTLAVEHPDPRPVWSTVRDLVLDHLENVNYIEAIKRTLGLKGLS
jgi:exopolyphosphatase/guanosine-5'-triphosphate,3'-diphosphate pyrophosphatase